MQNTMFIKIRKNAGMKSICMAMEIDRLLSDAVRSLISGSPAGGYASIDDAMDFASKVMSPSSKHWRQIDKKTAAEAWISVRAAIKARHLAA